MRLFLVLHYDYATVQADTAQFLQKFYSLVLLIVSYSETYFDICMHSFDLLTFSYIITLTSTLGGTISSLPLSVVDNL